MVQIQLFINDIKGHLTTITCSNSISILKLKELISNQIDKKHYLFMLMKNNVKLDENLDDTLVELGLNDQDTVYLLGKLDKEKAILQEFYRVCDGVNWRNGHHFISDRPIDTWTGVTTNHNGKVNALLNLGPYNDINCQHLPLELLCGLRELLDFSFVGLVNDVQFLPNQFPNLHILSITTNTFPQGIEHLPNLIYLDLSIHDIESLEQIPPYIFNLPNLKTLHVVGNKMYPTHLKFDENIVGTHRHYGHSGFTNEQEKAYVESLKN